MSDAPEAKAGPKPKKSVALSGVTAGNTALCAVGRSGNDLHYRGYDILDFADSAQFEEIAHLLGQGGDIGKRLDFLIQELHREANTLGSKSAVLEMTRLSVDMKVLIEQMREQVQNIE